jgi:pimeloyl-ACP methyl ester carboxylesterase
MRPFFLITLGIACAVAAMPSYAEETAATEGRFHEVRGAKLYVEGLGSGAPILFLHGGAVYFESTFAKQRNYFASFRKVIGIDQRGHGHSPDDERPFSHREMAEDTAVVIEQLGIGPVDVIGHSDGGNVGLILARYHPQLVRRLVVSGANLRTRSRVSTDRDVERLRHSAQQKLRREEWSSRTSAGQPRGLRG